MKPSSSASYLVNLQVLWNVAAIIFELTNKVNIWAGVHSLNEPLEDSCMP